MTSPPDNQPPCSSPDEGFCRWLGRCLGCTPPTSSQREARVRNRRVHMANERTMLAWLRTALGLMVLGFVVHRFNLFTREMARLSPGVARQVSIPSIHLGLWLIILGSLVGLLSAVRFLVVERQIEHGTYHPSALFSISLALVLAAVGLFMAVSLWESA